MTCCINKILRDEGVFRSAYVHEVQTALLRGLAEENRDHSPST